MTPEEREVLSHFPESKEYKDRVGGSKVQIVVWVVYTTLLWTLKICMLFFYSRLTYVSLHPVCCFGYVNICLQVIRRENVDKMRPRIRMGFFILPATFIVLLCVELFGCHPFQKHWQIYPDPGGEISLHRHNFSWHTRSYADHLQRSATPHIQCLICILW